MAAQGVDVIITEEQQQVEEMSPEETTKKRKWYQIKKNPDSSRKPPENKWFQQQIPACRPVFTAVHTFVAFLIIGVIFIILGSIFTAFSARLRQFEIPYQGCRPIETDDVEVRGFDSCEQYLESINISRISNFERRNRPDCHCLINFTLSEDIRPDWNFYYAIENYYQNHRRYLNSWDVSQLRGDGFTSPTSNCRPIVDFEDEEGKEMPVIPCGLIANSWFNDSFDIFRSQDYSINVTLDQTNIAWSTDRSTRFQNPGGADSLDPASLEGTTMPPNWPRNLSEINSGLQNESLMVWYRVSAFPWFKKLYGRPLVNGKSDETLPKGDYAIILTYNYPVSSFNGHKSIVLAEVNWLGGRNLFLGIAYLVVGVVLIVTAFGLLLMHLLCSNWKLSNAPFK